MNSPDAKPAQRDDPRSHRALSPSPSPSLSTSSSLFQRRTGAGTDEDEPDKLLYSNHSGVPAGKDGETQGEFKMPPLNASAARLPLCSLSVFRASDMLPFETYLHDSDCRSSFLRPILRYPCQLADRFHGLFNHFTHRKHK